MYDDNLRLQSKFEEADYDYIYCESAGGHSRKLWDQYIQYVLEWILLWTNDFNKYMSKTEITQMFSGVSIIRAAMAAEKYFHKYKPPNKFVYILGV